MALSAEAFAGGAREATIGADTVISRGNGSHWAITASSAGLKVKLELPSAWVYELGFPVFVLHNPGGTHAWALCTNDGTLIVNVGTGQYAKVGLSTLAGQGTWHAQVS